LTYNIYQKEGNGKRHKEDSQPVDNKRHFMVLPYINKKIIDTKNNKSTSNLKIGFHLNKLDNSKIYKDRNNKKECRDVVYKINCGGSYVGQTKR